jgi:predicted O-methyltransferase YrrM
LNDLLRTILQTGEVRDAAGQTHPLASALDRAECDLLSSVIENDRNIRRTLEVGCAHGISSLCICAATMARSSAHHVIIDPEQNGAGWKGIGVANLGRAGFKHFELIEEPSEYALPRLSGTETGSFDLVFIDGWHTFDHTMIDLFYANRLIRIGGYIVIDDYNWPAVRKAVSYFGNYPCYQYFGSTGHGVAWKRGLARLLRMLIPQTIGKHFMPKRIHEALYLYNWGDDSIAVLRKVEADNRSWNWYEGF